MCTLTAKLRTFIKKGQVSKAFELVLTANTKKRKVSAHNWNLLGSCLAKAGQIHKAQQAFDWALSLKPYDPAILNNMGNMKLIASRPSEAKDYYLKAIANNAFSGQPRFNLTLAYMEMGDFEKALEAYQEYVLVNRMGQTIKLVVLCACVLAAFWLLRL